MKDQGGRRDATQPYVWLRTESRKYIIPRRESRAIVGNWSGSSMTNFEAHFLGDKMCSGDAAPAVRKNRDGDDERGEYICMSFDQRVGLCEFAFVNVAQKLWLD